VNLKQGTSQSPVPTIKDVACLAGVSLKTVSRVINQDKGVSEKTREKVLAAIEAIGYRPNALARGLRAKRTYTIGVVIADITNSFYSSIVRGIEDEAFSRNYSVLVANSDELLEKEKLYVRVFAEKRVEGIIIVPAIGSQGYLKDLAPRIPLVFVDRPPCDFSGPVVKAENTEGAYALTRHLLEHGFENIAFVASDLRIATVRERFSGFWRALQERGLEVPHDFVKDGNKTVQDAYQATRELFALPCQPRAIFAANNLMLQGVLRAVEEAGFSVPQDVTVVGFDDFEMADIFRPRLTVAAQPAYAMGQKAASLLFRRMEGNCQGEERIVLPVELVLRESCGCGVESLVFDEKGEVRTGGKESSKVVEKRQKTQIERRRTP
jgi:LacI family transcriptional regulator